MIAKAKAIREPSGFPSPPLELKFGVLATATLALLAFAFLASPKLTSVTPEFGLLALGAVGLELCAVRTLPFGFFSSASMCYLAAALLPTVALQGECLLLLGAIGLRTLAHGHESVNGRLREAVADMLPPLMAGVVASQTPLSPALRAVAALVVYLPLAFLTPIVMASWLEPAENAAWGRVRGRLHNFVVANGFLGSALFALMRVNPLTALLLLPAALAAHGAARIAVERQEALDRIALEHQLSLAREGLHKASHSAGQLSESLAKKTEENEVLDRVARSLAHKTSVKEVTDEAVWFVQRLMPARSVAIFLEGDGRLLPASYKSPQATRLQSAELLDLHEPVVEQAWHFRKPVSVTPENLAARIFEGETRAVAIPMERVGVLYVGDTGSGHYDRDRVLLLGVLANHAALAVQSARNYQAQQQALDTSTAAQAELAEWVRLLGLVLEGSRALASTLDPRQLLEWLATWVAGMLPCDHALVLVPDSLRGQPVVEYRVDPPGYVPVPITQAMSEIVSRVIEQKVPLLYEDLDATRFESIVAGQKSLLAAPLMAEGEALGAVVLTSSVPGLYQRGHQDLLAVLANQAGAVLRNAHIHQDLVTVHQELADSQAQLIQSSKMAAVGQLAAGVAHEINTPLETVLLNVEMAMPEAAAAEGLLKRALKAATRASSIIKKLLFYSREGRDGMQRVSLNVVVSDTLDFIGHTLRMDSVTVEQDLQPVPEVLANHNELQQILTNLVLNARDAVLTEGAREPRIRIVTRTDGEHVVLEVQDYGPGIPAHVRDRIFEPFFTTKPVGHGTGLGLSVCGQIARRHGGELSVQSEEGLPTIFRLRLPVRAEGSADGGGVP